MSPEQITALFAERGHLCYEGKGITQLQHAWQCGRLARQARVTPELALAAWLHDLGHLTTGLQGSPTQRGIDDAHETLAAQALSALFGAEVAEPVVLHVRAKRYLVAVQPSHARALSPESVRSLALQGGPMSPAECDAFLSLPHAQHALRLRIWDDHAKERGRHPASPAQALAEAAGTADAGVAEGIEFVPGQVGRHLVAAQPQLAKTAHQADGGAALEDARRVVSPAIDTGKGLGAGVDRKRALEPEAGLQAAAQVLDAAKTESAARQHGPEFDAANKSTRGTVTRA